MTHKELVEHAYKWVLKRASCGCAFKELYTYAPNSEYPDVIGFGGWGHSVLVECKVSRSDFLADRKKAFRMSPELGMGKYRYMCCESGLIKTEELPSRWGLLYVSSNKIRCVHNPYGKQLESNMWENGFSESERNLLSEHALMYSVLRRLFIKGMVKHIYDKQYNRSTTPNELIALNQV
jgi:hypothetical protein